MSLSDYQMIGPICYQGKKGCRDVRCRHFFDEDGNMSEDCSGYHCSYCDEPCSMMGCGCDASKTLLAEAQRVIEERA